MKSFENSPEQLWQTNCFFAIRRQLSANIHNVRPIPRYESALGWSFVEDPLEAVEIPEETTQAATAGGG